MAKKSKSLPQRDHYARISHLYQLSATNSVVNPVLARAYAQTAQQVARKNVLRLSPHIKRSICRNCSTHLTPGVTCSTRLENPSTKSDKSLVLEVTCKPCGKVKRYPVGKDPSYELWVDKCSSTYS